LFRQGGVEFLYFFISQAFSIAKVEFAQFRALNDVQAAGRGNDFSRIPGAAQGAGIYMRYLFLKKAVA